MKKRLSYIIILILLIAVEVVIALTQHTNWLRAYGGDVIVLQKSENYVSSTLEILR